MGLTVAVVAIGAVVWYTNRVPTREIADPLQVQDDDWKRGATNPTVTIIEYSDFQCPACKAYYPIVDRLLKTFPTQLQLVYREYPLTRSHPNSFAAAMAAEAAGAQNKFFEFHDILFERQSEWSPLPNPQQKFENYAQELILGADQFKKDSRSSALKARVKMHQSSGDALRILGTPTFFVNGKQIENPQSFEDFKKIVDDTIANTPSTGAEVKEFHAHANFAVVVNGKAFDFSSDQFQSTEQKELNTTVHLHNKRGTLLHVHKENSTWQEFFQSLGMDLTKDCFIESKTTKYCSNDSQKLSLVLNGTKLTEWENMPVRDLDRLLIAYGTDSGQQLQDLYSKIVPDDACIYSETCPERGKPTDEEPCVGALGTKCD